ncbi:MAG: DNA alkylation repair protein [Methanomassiliicoccales archaeon]|nr:MAG: DNA alkylation repair protein [Methanomassiliicoccales archaeon]
MEYEEVIDKLKSLSNPEAVEGMARYGINPENNLGVNVTTLRKLAKEIGSNHELALRLWATGIRDARILAATIDDPKEVSEDQLERMVLDLNSWDICDHCCSDIFLNSRYAYKKAFEWSYREEEFVKRASFSLMARLAVRDKKADDEKFERFLSIIKREAEDERNYVKKAVNWALRQIGKRNLYLNKKAINTAKDIQKINSRSAKWIASDALRELTSDKIQKRLRR